MNFTKQQIEIAFALLPSFEKYVATTYVVQINNTNVNIRTDTPECSKLVFTDLVFEKDFTLRQWVLQIN